VKKASHRRWPTTVTLITVVAAMVSCGDVYAIDTTSASDQFETIRAYIQNWLSQVDIDNTVISSFNLKKNVIDDWSNQEGKYQIVSVRNPEDYANAGHIPHAINIYWIDILNDSNLAQLDTSKTQVLYCYYGHASMISYTILSLLGYRCRSLDFGMMDWNPDALVKAPWDLMADYQVETAAHEPEGRYPVPVIASDQSDVRSLIKARANEYFAGEGSPIMTSLDVKAIIDDWGNKESEYQIVCVESITDYQKGHLPHAMSIPLTEIAAIDNLRKLDPNRTTIVYSDNGQTGQLAATVLNLLGYKSIALKFGMMDWNQSFVDPSRLWDGTATYPIEKGN